MDWTSAARRCASRPTCAGSARRHSAADGQYVAPSRGSCSTFCADVAGLQPSASPSMTARWLHPVKDFTTKVTMDTKDREEFRIDSIPSSGTVVTFVIFVVKALLNCRIRGE